MQQLLYLLVQKKSSKKVEKSSLQQLINKALQLDDFQLDPNLYLILQNITELHKQEIQRLLKEINEYFRKMCKPEIKKSTQKKTGRKKQYKQQQIEIIKYLKSNEQQYDLDKIRFDGFEKNSQLEDMNQQMLVNDIQNDYEQALMDNLGQQDQLKQLQNMMNVDQIFGTVQNKMGGQYGDEDEMIDGLYWDNTQQLNMNMLRLHQIDLNQYKITEIVGDSISSQFRSNQKTVHLDKKLNHSQQRLANQHIKNNQQVFRKKYYFNMEIQNRHVGWAKNGLLEQISRETLDVLENNVNKYLEQRQNDQQESNYQQQQMDQYIEQSQQQNRSMASDMNYYSDLKKFFMQKTNHKTSSAISSMKELEMSNHDNKIQMETINEEFTNENIISAVFQSELQQQSLNEDSAIIYQYFRQNKEQKQYLSQAMQQADPGLKAQIFVQALNLMKFGKIVMEQKDRLNFSEIEVIIN